MIHHTKIVLPGEPKSTQHVYKYKRAGAGITGYMTEEGKTIKEMYAWDAKSQYVGQPPMKEMIQITVDLYFGTRRRQDIDNFFKLALDALSGIVWEDDSQIYELNAKKHYDKKYPRIEIVIYHNGKIRT